MRKHPVEHAGWRIIAAAIVLLGLAGCSRQGQYQQYEVFIGTVKALDIETGELFVRAVRAPLHWHVDRDIPCVATKDSELYINDRFCEIDKIMVGDSVELVGVRDAGRFVVSFANVTRGQPEAPLPALSPPPSEPTNDNPEN
ncbi:MAG: hypothetical protein ABIG44_02995 [Planctomycetota bacterium]